MKLAIVIPTYNEKENIIPLIHSIAKIIQRYHLDANIVVVDDNSPDGTGEMMEEFKNKNRDLVEYIHIIHRLKKIGLGTAILSGFNFALKNGADFIITMDADFSHNPKDIPRLLKASGSDKIVVGSRYIKGGDVRNWPPLIKLVSLFANFLARNFLGIKAKDCTAGFKCYPRSFVQSINSVQIYSSGYAFQVEMLYRAQKDGFKIMEIPIIFKERKSGPSKKSLKEILGSAKSFLKIFSGHILRE